MLRVARRWLDSLDGWRIDVANMMARWRDVDRNHAVRALSAERSSTSCSSPSTVTTTARTLAEGAGTAR